MTQNSNHPHVFALLAALCASACAFEATTPPKDESLLEQSESVTLAGTLESNERVERDVSNGAEPMLLLSESLSAGACPGCGPQPVPWSADPWSHPTASNVGTSSGGSNADTGTNKKP
ncbi:MAG TPA: hypothetical protein VM580_33680 [Labilithrix sp.]|jgi:hypothetical protein|nr:hypothetical protein [Labilithrix sp.]